MIGWGLGRYLRLPFQCTKATYIVVRQRAYDWINEVDGRFAIERLDVTAEKPRPTIENLKANLLGVSQMAVTYANMCLDGPWIKHLRAEGLINKVGTKNYAALSGHANQFYVGRPQFFKKKCFGGLSFSKVILA